MFVAVRVEGAEPLRRLLSVLLGMDKKDKKVVTLNTIKNKLTRERLWQQIKHKKKLEKKERRTKKQEQRKEYGGKRCRLR